jgi:CubicO group peptidase (beta-lactamase class C family)
VRTFAVVASIWTLVSFALPASGAPGIRDRTELEAFIDHQMASALNETHVAGGTIAIVQGGRVLLAKGYGWSDVERHRPADGTHTLFRLGSITKLFTWTAAMQLVEAGVLDPAADVNRYLDFQIPPTYPEPITLADLATHTAGFEDDGRDLWTTDARDIRPIGVWLSRHMPTRVRPPGLWTSYSNHGAALAGHIVERISGLEWCDYVEQRILVPLRMVHTSCRQPVQQALAEDVSQGYLYRDGRFVPQAGEMLTGAAPAGAMTASAADMAVFMLAQLGHARAEQAILRGASLSAMHARWFGPDPALPGMAFGFYESWNHGLRMIGHEGDTRWFHTNLVLVPSEDLGVFVAFNTNTAGPLSAEHFLARFFDHYYPTQPLGPPPPSAEAVAQARRVAGEYESLRRSYTTFQRALSLAGPSATFTNDASGGLTMTWGLGDVKLVPDGKLMYRDEHGSERVLFKEDSSGQVTRAFVGSAPMLAFERMSWYRSPRLHWAILALSTMSFAVAIVIAGGLSIRRITRRLPTHPADPAGGLLTAAATTYLTFAIVMAVLTSDPIPMLSGSMTPVRTALALPPIGVVLVLTSAVLVIRDWRRKNGSTMRRAWHTVLLTIMLLFTWSLGIWNLLWWQV